LETEEKVKEGQRGLRLIVSDAGREPSPSDDLCIEAITKEWSLRAAGGFVIDIGRIPNNVSPETERLLSKHGWCHAERLQNWVPESDPDIDRGKPR
jgi:hypothetical protein